MEMSGYMYLCDRCIDESEWSCICVIDVFVYLCDRCICVIGVFI